MAVSTICKLQFFEIFPSFVQYLGGRVVNRYQVKKDINGQICVCHEGNVVIKVITPCPCNATTWKFSQINSGSLTY